MLTACFSQRNSFSFNPFFYFHFHFFSSTIFHFKKHDHGAYPFSAKFMPDNALKIDLTHIYVKSAYHASFGSFLISLVLFRIRLLPVEILNSDCLF